MAEGGRLSRLRARIEDEVRARRAARAAVPPKPPKPLEPLLDRVRRFAEDVRHGPDGPPEKPGPETPKPADQPKPAPEPEPDLEFEPWPEASKPGAEPEAKPKLSARSLGTSSTRLGDLGSSRADALRERAASVRSAGGGLWARIPLGVRQRLAAGAVLLAIVAFIVFVIAPVAPCWVPGGDRCAPEDEAIALVPTDVLAYGHVNLGTDTDEYEDASALAERLPVLVDDALAALPSATGRLVDYDRDVRPWSGGEAALVVDSQGLEVERLLMFEVDDAEAAAEFGESRLRFGAETSFVDGVEITVDSDGFAFAIADDFLLLGPEASVRRGLGVAAGDEESLADADAAKEARAELPEDRTADLWISPELAAVVSGDRQFRAIDTFLNQQATDGAAVSLSLREDSIELAVRSLQDPELADAAPDFFATLPEFEPTLPESINADALAYLGLGSPAESAEELLDQAAKAAPDLLAGFERFSRRLAEQEGVAIEKELLPIFDGEVALTVEPTDGAKSADPATPGVVPSIGTPYVALLADDIDSEAALEVMAGLQAPIAAAVNPKGDLENPPPLFETAEIGGIEAAALQISSVVSLTYAAFDDRLLVASSPVAVERAASVDDALADDDDFEEVAGTPPGDPSLLAFLDVRELLTLGERIGLATDPAYARLAGDLRTLEAASLIVRREDDLLSTDLRISVGEPEVAATDSPVLEVEPG